MRAGAVQRVNRLCVIVIEDVGITQSEPGESAGIFPGMPLRVSGHPRVSSGTALLQKLLCHRL